MRYHDRSSCMTSFDCVDPAFADTSRRLITAGRESAEQIFGMRRFAPRSPCGTGRTQKRRAEQMVANGEGDVEVPPCHQTQIMVDPVVLP